MTAAIVAGGPGMRFGDDLAEVHRRIGDWHALLGARPTPWHRSSPRAPRGQRVRRMARQDPAVSLAANPVVYGLMTGLTRLAGGGIAASKAAPLWDWIPPIRAAKGT
jgi:hypothetical protein